MKQWLRLCVCRNTYRDADLHPSSISDASVRSVGDASLSRHVPIRGRSREEHGVFTWLRAPRWDTIIQVVKSDPPPHVHAPPATTVCG